MGMGRWKRTTSGTSATRLSIAVELRLVVYTGPGCITPIPLKGVLVRPWGLFLLAKEAIMHTRWALVCHDGLLVDRLLVA